MDSNDHSTAVDRCAIHSQRGFALIGHGIAVNSTEGNVTLRNVLAEFNSADGIHYLHNDTFLQFPDTFCTRPQLTYSQTYPLNVAGYQRDWNYSKRGEDCSQVTKSQKNPV